MRDHERFVWGRIVEEYEIGPYHIARYQPYKDGGQPRTVDESRANEYHVWVDGEDTSNGAMTLEGAMLIAIAHKSLGPHPRGLDMIARALKMQE